MTETMAPSRPLPLWFYVLLIAVVTILAYTRVYTSSFISWDDPELLLHNKDVHTFNLRAFFSGSYIGNYMPLTMLVYALEWSMFQASSLGYHVCNVFFHCLNGVLVFLLSYRLLKHQWKALTCALIFCLHPLQTESVAWVAETKTLLFAFFFLWGLIVYASYTVHQKPRTLYGPVLILFILSALSKPAAICFPLCLYCIDLILGRPFTKKTWLEKIPFFVVSLVVGSLTLYTQQHDRFINADHAFAWYQRIGYAGYAMASYLGSFLLPIKQSVIYPYPKEKGLALALGYLCMLAFIILLYALYQKKRLAMLGMVLFVFFNLLLVLQFVPFGEVLTADRYMYLPVLGLSWMLLHLLNFKETSYRVTGATLALVLGIFTFSRSEAWCNSIALYSDIVKKYPNSFVALNSLGAEYMLQGNTQLAYAYLNKAVSNSPEYYKGYYNRGLLNMQTNKTAQALSDFSKAIEFRQYVKAYVGRASLYYSMKDYARTIADAFEALRQEPGNIKANVLLANCYEALDQLDQAIYYYNAGIALSPDEPLFYFRRAILYGKQQNFQACLKDLDACLQLQPGNAEAYYWKGVAKVNLKQNPCGDFREAARLGFREAQGAADKYCR